MTSRILLISVVSLLISLPAIAHEPFGDEFWRDWSDGRGELSGYELTMPRYGELRKGTAVTIFVTEPFSDRARVKADPGKHPEPDVFQVLKLNLVRDFPTGIYDYNLMTSVFVATQAKGRLPAGTPAKISFSAQEWCGQVYQQLLVRPPRAIHEIHSYFDGEADQSKRLDWKKDGVAEDALFFWARRLGGPTMLPGEEKTVPLLPSLAGSRLQHAPLSWKTVSLSVSGKPETILVPAGEFDTEVRTAVIAGGRTWTFYIEIAHPHRIVKWTSSDGEQGELLASERLAYWQMNGPEFESAVEKLGLRPRPARTP